MPRIQRHYSKPKPYATEVARKGKWKLMAMDGRPVALFDLEADPLEEVNLLEKKPEVVESLAKDVRGFLSAERDRRGWVQ
jgi:N-acetylgalactosamine-6-sulfatase